MRYIIICLVCLVSTFGCKERTGLEKEVMDIHDAVMPKIGELNKDRKALKKLISDNMDDSTKVVIRKAIADLEDADDGMMEWMADWSVPDDEPERTAYLKSELTKISKVRDDMLSSMQKAKLLKSNLSK